MDRGYTPSAIAEIVGGKVIHPREVWIQHYCIDSRKAFGGADVLFIAIKTAVQDGHPFAESAFQKGVRCFLVQRELPLPSEAIQIVVSDCIAAIQNLAAHHRRRFNIPVVGITGSNGKTIVKEWLNQLLSSQFKICRSPRSYNSQIGVALSVLQLNETHELGIFEAGISQPEEMDILERIIAPTIGVLTHWGISHIENFENPNALLKEKLKLFQNTTIWVSPEIDAPDQDKQHLSWGVSLKNRWRLKTSTKSTEGSIIELMSDDQVVLLALPFQDEIQIKNAITAAVTAHQLGMSWNQIQMEIGNLSSIDMRMEQLAGIHQTILINDAYSFDIASLRLAMQDVTQRYKDRKRILICSDFASSLPKEARNYLELANAIRSFHWDEIFWVGQAPYALEPFLRDHVYFFSTTEGLAEFLVKREWTNEVILIKGARQFEFEKIVHRLQASHHLTRLEIDLNALKSNLMYYRSQLHVSTRMMVMVKAFGYGAGAKEVAQLLEENRVDYLGVAYIDEGLALRKAGVSLPIMVMNPESEGIHSLIQFHLEPEIYSLKSLMDWLKEKDRYHILQPLKIHLKIDTGMHRLGLMEKDWALITHELLRRQDIEVISIFTHLSSADMPSEDEFTMQQLSIFERAKAYFSVHFPKAFYHCSNSAAISRFPSAQMDMVRLGIGIYGVSNRKEDHAHLIPVHRWVSHVSQVIEVPEGDSVGYGRSFIASSNLRIATIPVGYADGYKRILSNGRGSVIINGAKASVVGRVCMDMLMADVTNIVVKEGDEVILLGGEITLEDMAEWCETIPYEILTSISQRVKRVYIAS